MKYLNEKILGDIASLVTVLGFIYTIRPVQPFTLLQWGLVAVFVMLFGVTFFRSLKDATRPIVFSTKREIRDYMFKWVNNGGRVAIFTRDMSWVDDDEMKDMLSKKANKKELIICLPEMIPIANDLKGKGALVIEYANFQYQPKSRFTIVNFGRDDSSVAVGKSLRDGKHSIEVYSNGEHPYFQVANDLVCLLEKKP